MNIGMVKLNETDNYVLYRFDTNIYELLNSQYSLITKYGYCKFNKATEEFELDIDKTDPYFLSQDSREVIKVKVKLIRLKRENNGYPDQTGIATG